MRAGSWSPKEEKPDGLERNGVGILLFQGRRNSGYPSPLLGHLLQEPQVPLPLEILEKGARKQRGVANFFL